MHIISELYFINFACIWHKFLFLKEVNEQLDDLDKHVFTTCIEMHGEPLVAGIESGMQVAEFKWNGHQEPKGKKYFLLGQYSGRTSDVARLKQVSSKEEFEIF